MKQVYSRKFTATFATGGSKYVFADKIDPGYVLHVFSCAAYSPGRDASDDVIIGIRNGGQDIVLTAQAPLAAQLGVDAPGSFFVGEGDRVFANFPDVGNTEVIELHINGVLVPLEEWDKMVE